MMRYEKLITEKAEAIGYHPLSREMKVPITSLHDWATMNKIPHAKSLEKIAKYFNVPMPTLLMEVGKRRNYEDDIVEAICTLTPAQKKLVAEFIKGL
jgi:transcriptional regulator with XRE-family HTH domain